jgi:hypothetical protein
VNSIFLHLAGGDLGDPELAEEGEKVQPQANAVTLDPARAAMALGDELVLLEELLGDLAEELFGFEEAGAVLAAQRQTPILGDLLGEGEALLGAGAALLAADRRRALPEAAVAALVDLELPADEEASGFLLTPCFGSVYLVAGRGFEPLTFRL